MKSLYSASFWYEYRSAQLDTGFVDTFMCPRFARRKGLDKCRWCISAINAFPFLDFFHFCFINFFLVETLEQNSSTSGPWRDVEFYSNWRWTICTLRHLAQLIPFQSSMNLTNRKWRWIPNKERKWRKNLQNLQLLTVYFSAFPWSGKATTACAFVVQREPWEEGTPPSVVYLVVDQGAATTTTNCLRRTSCVSLFFQLSTNPQKMG